MLLLLSGENGTKKCYDPYTARIMVGQLLCGVQSAYDELATMPRSTQYRYLANVAALSKRTRGRPLKV